jgi:hypothetical protein
VLRFSGVTVPLGKEVVMKKLMSLIVLILLCGIISDCDIEAPEGLEAHKRGRQLELARSPIKEYWFADYMPLVPGSYGIKTYAGEEESDFFTSKIVGTETVPYSTGPVTGVKMSFGDHSFVFHNDKRSLWWLKSGDYILSTTCHELTAYPPSAVIGKVHDGMILDMTGGETIWQVNANDLDDCEEVNTGESNSYVELIQIQDVHMHGKTYKNAILWWELEPNSPYAFAPIDFRGIDEILGIRLPTADETNDWAVDDVIIWGHRVGILFLGDIHLDSGELRDFIYLVSVSHKPSP